MKTQTAPSTIELVGEIFSQPTAPFREFWVLSTIEDILKDQEIPYFFDSQMNLIAGVANERDLQKARLMFLAHTDHPGFHVLEPTHKKK